MPGVVSNKSNAVMWNTTPLDKRLPNVGWSEDCLIRIYDSGRTDTFDKYIRNSGQSFTEYVVYLLYYDNKENMTYLKDIREDVLYAIPSGSKSKGYTLAFKLNLYYNTKGGSTKESK
jgi:hypothetical protein